MSFSGTTILLLPIILMSLFASRLKRFIQMKVYAPHYFSIDKIYGQDRFKLLDVGCGVTSVHIFKNFFPKIEYHGIDYNNPGIREMQIGLMDRYYECDLNAMNFSEIPDHYFDCIVLSHVLEHLDRPIDVLNGIINKLKKNGYIYIEYPSKKSVHIISSSKLPFVSGTLNFYDDKTHVAPCD